MDWEIAEAMRRKARLSGIFDFFRKKAGSKPAPQASTTEDLYAILEVSPTASPDELRAAYRKLAAKYHPDRNPGNAETYQRFLDIARAHDILSEPTQRAAYDQARGASAPAGRSEEAPFYYPSTYILTEEERAQAEAKAQAESKKPRPRPAPPWDVLFTKPTGSEKPFFEFSPRRSQEQAQPVPWEVFFPERPKVTLPTREKLLEGISKLPLQEIWSYIRNYRLDPAFLNARRLIVGPVAGGGYDPVEHDIAVLTGTSFEEIAHFAEKKGLHKAWANILGPLAEQVVYAIESVKPGDIPGHLYMDWDPSGKMLELIYVEPGSE